MAKVIDDEFMVCVDCGFAIANGDMPEDQERADEVERAISNVQKDGAQIVNGDSSNDLEFSWSPCDCCGSTLGGARMACAILQ